MSSEFLAYTPEVFQELVADIMQSAFKPQLTPAIGAALAVFSGLVQATHEIETKTGIRLPLNLYQVIVGKSGSGKDDYINIIRRLLSEYGDFLVTDELPQSNYGLFNKFYVSNSLVFCGDEGQDAFASLGNKSNGQHVLLLKKIKELYTASVYSMPTTKEFPVSRTLHDLSFGIVAAATGSFIKHLAKPHEMEGGFTARFLVHTVKSSDSVSNFESTPFPFAKWRVKFREMFPLDPAIASTTVNKVSQNRESLMELQRYKNRTKEEKESLESKKLFTKEKKSIVLSDCCWETLKQDRLNADMVFRNDEDEFAPLKDRSQMKALRIAGVLEAIEHGIITSPLYSAAYRYVTGLFEFLEESIDDSAEGDERYIYEQRVLKTIGKYQPIAFGTIKDRLRTDKTKLKTTLESLLKDKAIDYTCEKYSIHKDQHRST